MQLVENITNFYPDSVDKEYPNMACGSWIATENGIFSSETSKARELVCHHPIMPIRRLKNHWNRWRTDHSGFWKRDGYWTETNCSKNLDIVTSRAITNLARFGVQVNSENARLLVNVSGRCWNVQCRYDRHTALYKQVRMAWQCVCTLRPFDRFWRWIPL